MAIPNSTLELNWPFGNPSCPAPRLSLAYFILLHHSKAPKLIGTMSHPAWGKEAAWALQVLCHSGVLLKLLLIWAPDPQAQVCVTEESSHDPNDSNRSCSGGLLKRHRADCRRPPSLTKPGSFEVGWTPPRTLECCLRRQVLDPGGCPENEASCLGTPPAGAPSLGANPRLQACLPPPRSQLNSPVKPKSYRATHSPPGAPHLIQSMIPNSFLLNWTGLVPTYLQTDRQTDWTGSGTCTMALTNSVHVLA